MSSTSSITATLLPASPAAGPRASQAGAPQAFSQVLAQEMQPKPATPPSQASARPRTESAPAEPAPAGEKEVSSAPATEETATPAGQADKRQEAAAPEASDEASKADPSLLLAMVGSGREHQLANQKKAAISSDAQADEDALLTGKRASRAEAPLEALDRRAALAAQAQGEDAALPDDLAPGLQAGGKGPPALQEGTSSPFASALSTQQAAHSSQATAAATAAPASLPARVGTPQWDQALGQRMVWMVNGAQQSASLTLNPPELGPLQVMLTLSDSQAQATFIAAQPEVRQALEAALPRLREMLDDAGIQLGQASVNAGTPDQQPGFAQEAFGSAAGGTGHRSSTAAENSAVGTTTAAAPAAVKRGLVDTFA